MIDYREDAKWTVYVHIVPKELICCNNNKYYVGITSRPTNVRWGKNGNGYKGQNFYEKIKNLDWSMIEHDIVATNLTMQEAKDFERLLIKHLDSNNPQFGYNIGKGGDANEGWHHTQENLDFFKIRSGGSNNPNAKTLYQFTLDGIFIDKHGCATDAALKIGRKLNSKDNITHAARTNQSCNGFLWCYEDNIYIDDNGNIK